MQADGLHTAARWLSRCHFVAGVLSATVVLAYPVSRPLLDPQLRLLLVGLGLIPPVGFVISTCLQLGRRPLLHRSVDFWVRTFLSTLVLFLPVGYLLIRHAVPWLMQWDGWGFVAAILVLLAVPIPGLGGADEIGDIRRAIVAHVFRVMWWVDDPAMSENMRSMIRKRYSRWFTDRVSLEVFQKTWRGRAREGEAIAAIIGRVSQVRSILDVGGGGGELTGLVLRSIAGARRESTGAVCVDMLDPIDWSSKYREETEGAGAIVRCATGTFGVADRDWQEGKYDVVVAVHSLYGVAANGADQNLPKAVRRLKQLCGSAGVVIICLASRSSRAYAFKRHALLLLLGVEVEDLAAEDLSLIEALGNAKRVVVDHVFDLSGLLAEYDAGRRADLVRWLRYFLRVDLEEQGEPVEAVVALLKSYLQEVGSLPVGLIRGGELPPEGPGALVLPHKTEIWSVHGSGPSESQAVSSSAQAS